MKKILPALLLMLAACSGRESILFVGTYSDGFFACDYASGEVIAKADMPNPSFLALEGNKVYAVSEMPDSSASVYAWRMAGKTPAMLPPTAACWPWPITAAPRGRSAAPCPA